MAKSYFKNLPTKILYQIYDELDTQTILFRFVVYIFVLCHLTLSDNLETAEQIQLFFSYFHLNQFIRLRSLTLACDYDQDLGELENYVKKCSLNNNFNIILWLLF
ncbi:hypothetical protein I4U23_004707 [Adineta vaga]|nr:hypothetical protein I4U23_004707 [Adineta vaga]